MPHSVATDRELRLTEPELVSWGERFGRACRAPALVTLEGELGTGKTTLARAICRGFGVADADEVTSPTFALVHEYQATQAPVYHVDLYRLAGPEDLTNLGWDELVSAHALVLIEWPDRAGARLPPLTARLRLAYAPEDPQVRLLRVEAGGEGA